MKNNQAKFKLNFRNYLFGALSGVLFGLAFPPVNLWIFGFVFAIPLLFSLENTFDADNRNEKHAGRRRILYAMFCVQHLMTLWWIGGWQANQDKFLMLAGILICVVRPFIYFIPFEGYFYIRRKSGFTSAIAAFPFLWTGFEWILSVTEWAFPWISLGYTQVSNQYFNQIADLGGVLLLSFVTNSINTIVFYCIYKYLHNTERSIRGSFKFSDYGKEIALLAVLLILPIAYSAVKYNTYSKFNPENAKTLSVAVIQPNINPWAKWERSPMENAADHIHIQDSLNARFPGKTDLSLWTETSITFLDSATNSYPYNVNFLHSFSDVENLSVISGFTELYFYRHGGAPASANYYLSDSSLRYQHFNSAIAVLPNDVNVQIYRKMRLTPVSERIPYVDQIPFAKNMLHWNVGISNWGLGKEQKTLMVKGKNGSFPVASIICIESIHGDFIRKFALLGASIFTVITNDAWYSGTSGPAQHFAMSQMRAIENRRYTVRCGNGGISGLINPAGKVESLLPVSSYVGKIFSVPEMRTITFYSKYGDFTGYFSAILAIIFICLSIKRKNGHEKN